MGLKEVRLLSKLINPEAIKNIELKEAVQLEIDRFNRLNFIKSNLEIIVNEKKIDVIWEMEDTELANLFKTRFSDEKENKK